MNPQASQLTSFKVCLKDLDVAPENPRFHEEADEYIPNLAMSLAPNAAGQLLPILVRRGNKKEMPYMVLDGRRRLLGFRSLQEQGLISDDLEILAELCETEEAIAAALVTANGERLPVSPADKLLAIRAMVDKKFSAEKIGRGLCMDIGEVRKFQFVAKVDLEAIHAFKAKLIDFNTLKLIARIKSAGEQKALIKQAQTNGFLNSSQVRSYLEQEGISANSSKMKVVGLKAYMEAGGQVVSDLLNELPDTCLDVGIVDQLWSSKLEALRGYFEGLGLVTYITPDTEAELSDEYGNPGYRYMRSKAQSDAIVKAQQKLSEARSALNEIEDGETLEVNSCLHLYKALYDCALANLDPMPVRAVLITPGDHTILNFEFVTSQTDIETWQANREVTDTSQARPDKRPYDIIPERKIVIDTEGSSNAYHRLATEMAVRGLQRSLADSFATALKLQVSTMFEQVVLTSSNSYLDDRALKVTYGRNIQSENYGAVEGLDQEIVERLIHYKAAYTECGLRPYEWISNLAFVQIQDLLALMTAASLWITEEATSTIRKSARAQIQEVAEEIGHDIRNHWFPSANFYAKCSKKQLLSFAQNMGSEVETLTSLKKGDLASYVAEQGVVHHWVPAALCFDNDLDSEGKAVVTGIDSADQKVEANLPDVEEDDGLDVEEEPYLYIQDQEDAA